ncbi:MAG: RNA polymerase sigma factor RpoD, partial [Variovorax sp.]
MPSSKKPAVSVAKKTVAVKPLKAAASPAPAKKSAATPKATAATKVKPVPTKTPPADLAPVSSVAAGKAVAPATAKKVGRPPKAAGAPAAAATGAKRGRKPKAGNEPKEIEEDFSDVEAEFAEEEPVAAVAGTETATVEKVKPLRMKISKAKERALMKEFGLDETVLSEEDMAKRRS